MSREINGDIVAYRRITAFERDIQRRGLATNVNRDQKVAKVDDGRLLKSVFPDCDGSVWQSALWRCGGVPSAPGYHIRDLSSLRGSGKTLVEVSMARQHSIRPELGLLAGFLNVIRQSG
jgi:hypothetical protein